MGFYGYVTFMVISPEPEVSAIFHLNLICGHIVTFNRAQVCSNRFSHLQENDVSLMEVGLKITLPVIFPEPEVATMIQIHLIYGHYSFQTSPRLC